MIADGDVIVLYANVLMNRSTFLPGNTNAKHHKKHILYAGDGGSIFSGCAERILLVQLLQYQGYDARTSSVIFAPFMRKENYSPWRSLETKLYRDALRVMFEAVSRYDGILFPVTRMRGGGIRPILASRTREIGYPTNLLWYKHYCFIVYRLIHYLGTDATLVAFVIAQCSGVKDERKIAFSFTIITLLSASS